MKVMSPAKPANVARADAGDGERSRRPAGDAGRFDILVKTAGSNRLAMRDGRAPHDRHVGPSDVAPLADHSPGRQANPLFAPDVVASFASQSAVPPVPISCRENAGVGPVGGRIPMQSSPVRASDPGPSDAGSAGVENVPDTALQQGEPSTIARRDVASVSIVSHSASQTLLIEQVGAAVRTILSDAIEPSAHDVVPIPVIQPSTIVNPQGIVRTIVVELAPRSLGSVRVTLHAAGANTRVQIDVENLHAAKAIGDVRSELAAILDQSGQPTAQIDVVARNRPAASDNIQDDWKNGQRSDTSAGSSGQRSHAGERSLRRSVVERAASRNQSAETSDGPVIRVGRNLLL